MAEVDAMKNPASPPEKVNKKNSNPLKVRSLAKFMQDQNEHEIKRHEKLKKIIVDEWTNGKYTYNPQLSSNTKKIIEEMEKSKVKPDNEENPEKFVRKPFVPDEPSFKPAINERSKHIKRGADITTTLVNDALVREARM